MHVRGLVCRWWHVCLLCVLFGVVGLFVLRVSLGAPIVLFVCVPCVCLPVCIWCCVVVCLAVDGVSCCYMIVCVDCSVLI